MRPKQAGTIFVQTARRILAELRRLDEELDLLSTSRGGAVAIGALPVAATGVLPGALTPLKSSSPDILVRLQQRWTEERLLLLAAGELDLIVGRLYESAVPDSFQRRPLWEEANLDLGPVPATLSSVQVPSRRRPYGKLMPFGLTIARSRTDVIERQNRDCHGRQQRDWEGARTWTRQGGSQCRHRLYRRS
jgi:DNA-binding transcriptional LysR family regulator